MVEITRNREADPRFMVGTRAASFEVLIMQKRTTINHWITAHELAKLLLSGPNLPILIPIPEDQQDDCEDCSGIGEVRADDEAVYLCMHSTRALTGGPFDGLAVSPKFGLFVHVSAGQGRVAVYEENPSGQLAFTGTRKTGEGCMPDIYPEKQNGRQG